MESVSGIAKPLCHADLIGYLETLVPNRLSESWDNCGLQAGTRKTPLKGVLCCLDISDEVIDEALAIGANFVFSNNPLMTNPLARLGLHAFPGILLSRSLASEITLFSAHTNLDSVSGGVNDHLAELLGVDGCSPIIPGLGQSCKLIIFVPVTAVDRVAAALFAAGAGELGVGRYNECSFRSSGTGTFRPGVGAVPQVGEVGKINFVDEVRLEMTLDEKLISRVLAALQQAHPYEVPAYDLYSARFSEPGCGAGRIGEIAHETDIDEFSLLVKNRLNATSVKLIGGGLKKCVKRIALCGGSGFSLYKAAQIAGADLFVTGDLKYHDARSVLEQGEIPVLDAGHFATERHVVEVCARWCRDFVLGNNVSIEVATAQSEQEPWTVM